MNACLLHLHFVVYYFIWKCKVDSAENFTSHNIINLAAYHAYFTFMLLCITIDFLLNNQPDTLIIQIYSVIKLYMFRASSIRTPLGSSQQKPA